MADLPLRIAHVSDLHFGMSGQSAVWDSLSRYLIQDLKPDAVFVTGDVVDTPDAGQLQNAARMLDAIKSTGAKLVVCPGNHDRHPQGNALDRFVWLGRLLERLRGNRIDPALFDQLFQGMVANLNEPIDLTLERPGQKWQIRVIGIDTSINSRFSAQGQVIPDALQSVKGITQAAPGREMPFDLVVSLIHHHLLPIAALERSQQSITGLANFTVLVNAGTVLENFAINNVNLVLHGHEHFRNIARYSLVDPERASSEITVVGAGSGTGASTTQGCELNRASINVFELRPDRTVWLAEARPRGGQWEYANNLLKLIDAGQIRMARTLRKTDAKRTPTSRMVRHFDFLANRNFSVRESRTDWVLGSDPTRFGSNRPSGFPILDSLQIAWVGGGEFKADVQQLAFKREDGSDSKHALVFSTPARKPALARRIDLEYTWLRGAVLTDADMRHLPAIRRGYYRLRGLESVAAFAPGPLESITLSVALPRGFAPDRDSFRVFVEPPNGVEPSTNGELDSFLQVTAGGFASLAVPYPLPDYRYVLAWEPAVAPPCDTATLQMRGRAAQFGGGLVKGVLDAVKAAFDKSIFTVALYVPETRQDGSLTFRSAAIESHDVPANLAGAQPDALHSPRSELDVLLGAFYGDRPWAVAEREGEADIDLGVKAGERAVLVLPAFLPGWKAAAEPWGIIRIGWLSNEILAPGHEDILASTIAAVEQLRRGF